MWREGCLGTRQLLPSCGTCSVLRTVVVFAPNNVSNILGSSSGDHVGIDWGGWFAACQEIFGWGCWHVKVRA
jgi:hypothetical protein